MSGRMGGALSMPKISNGLRKERVILLLVDPQVDFHPGGSLAVVGADADSDRIADLIRSKIFEIDEIIITLDSHHRMHIAHSCFWTNDSGENPPNFSLITNADLEQGLWKPKNESLTEYCKYYTKELEAKGKFKLCIWPEHCLIGTPGHAVVSSINSAVQEWAKINLKTAYYHMKGMNCLTEMYSAVEAEVVLKDDPATGVDERFLGLVLSADQLIVGGQALSHCVKFTFEDIKKRWTKHPSNMVLLLDGSSPVAGFEDTAESFVSEMREATVTVVTTGDAEKIISESKRGKSPASSGACSNICSIV